jgi:hypothetical protein
MELQLKLFCSTLNIFFDKNGFRKDDDLKMTTFIPNAPTTC